MATNEYVAIYASYFLPLLFLVLVFEVDFEAIFGVVFKAVFAAIFESVFGAVFGAVTLEFLFLENLALAFAFIGLGGIKDFLSKPIKSSL